MCLRVWDGAAVVQVADEDIVCYKVLTRHDESPYRHMPYKAGELVTSELDKGVRPVDSDGEPYGFREYHIGLHTFIFSSEAEYEARDWSMMGMAVWHAVIPKGSRYIVGDFAGDKSYVSDALMLVKKIGSFNGFHDKRQLDTEV